MLAMIDSAIQGHSLTRGDLTTAQPYRLEEK